jgi:hypothetical protein
MDGFKCLAAVTLAANGLLAGASLDQSVKQLPARHTIGATAYAGYARAADGSSRGIAWYGLVGVGTAAATIAMAVMAITTDQPRRVRSAAVAAGVLSLLHSFTTTRAAPIMLGLRGAGDDDRGTGSMLDRFERRQTARVVGQVATLVATLVATVATRDR